MMACGPKPPQTEMATAQSAVSAAEVGGAEEIPKGKLHLKKAREAIDEAAQLMERKDNAEARRLLMRAEMDARYALALANYDEAQKEAAEVLEKIEEMMGAAK
jgi:hypothetical protein